MADPFYQSAEIRWFLPGDGPRDALLRWFGAEPDQDAPTLVTREKARTDSYLLLPNCDSSGVKQREGKLEVKARVAGPFPIARPEAVGRVDRWVKWSFAPSEGIAPALETELSTSGPWREVEKVRYLRRLSFDSGRAVAVAPDERPDSGCTIELTELTVERQAWLTVGFEAFGPPARLLALLDEALGAFFAERGAPPLPLEGRDSMSYPTWIAMM